MNTPFEQCDHWLILSDRHRAFLQHLPEPLHYAPVEEVSCSLQRGHPERHLAIGQAGGLDDDAFRARWVHWSEQGTGVAFVKADTWCGQQGKSWRPEDAEDPGPLVCRMPREHGGAHDFQIEWFYRPVSPQMQQWIDRYEAEHCL